MKLKPDQYPAKRTMNLYYKPDRTTRPATIALYVLFALAVLLALSRFLIFDLWMEVRSAQNDRSAAQQQLESTMTALSDYGQVRENYQRYSATEEEAAIIDRMQILDLLDSAVGASADIGSITVSGSTVQVQFSRVSLAQAAEIVSALERSSIVANITVNTASTTNEDRELVSADIHIQLQKEAGTE